MTAAVSRATKRPTTADECPLFMECVDEGLSEAQKRARTERSAKFIEQMKNLEEMAKNPSARSVPSTGQAVRLLMDRNTGRIVGTLNQNQGPGVQNRGGLRAVRQPTVVNVAGDGKSINDKARRFPSLTVSARTQKVAPNLSVKRGELDTKVKALLVQPAAKFAEWLIKEGLVPPEQYCTQYSNTKTKLKLGKYSDNKKYATSGGYVWVGKGSGDQKQYTSVFKGSIFEASNHSPTVVLKLIYHWSCQTNIQNVVQWVKVDYTVVNLFFQIFRSVCVASIQEEMVSMGGPGKEVEIGVISLGTVSEDGKKRQVRVLGIFDRSTGSFRLRAGEPRPSANQNEWFNLVAASMPVWVHKGSTIISDYFVDNDKLRALGYTVNVQSNTSGRHNVNIMDYLRKVVPKMFQNSLSLLTIAAIQQHLDELTFREWCGHHPLVAFESLLQRISNQTAAAVERNTTFTSRMKSVASSPADDWRIHKA